jgi:hypothetical protein
VNSCKLLLLDHREINRHKVQRDTQQSQNPQENENPRGLLNSSKMEICQDSEEKAPRESPALYHGKFYVNNVILKIVKDYGTRVV